MAESVMIALAGKGMDRQLAHEMVRVASMKALAEGKPLDEILAQDPAAVRCLSRQEIHDLLNPDRYTGTAVQQVERLYENLKRNYLNG
jgi:adenylosuccinate lyase